MRRTLAIGDVHGCLEELRDLLRVTSYSAADDRLVFVGDLVDRGPDPVGTVHLVRELAERGDVICVMGNHEEKLVRWFRRVAEEKTLGKRNMMSPPDPKRLAEWEALSEDDRAWLGSRPVLSDAIPEWLVVHAGFEAGRSMEEQRPNAMMRCRWVSPETGKMVVLDSPRERVPWTEQWRGDRNVVYGHAVHSLESPRIDRPTPDIECWGIDTGCCFGGRLTALHLETRDVFQVPARAKYADLLFDDVE